MMVTESLWEKAERCFRLAAAVSDSEIASKLQQLGRDYEDAARSVEAANKRGRGLDERSN